MQNIPGSTRKMYSWLHQGKLSNQRRGKEGDQYFIIVSFESLNFESYVGLTCAKDIKLRQVQN